MRRPLGRAAARAPVLLLRCCCCSANGGVLQVIIVACMAALREAGLGLDEWECAPRSGRNCLPPTQQQPRPLWCVRAENCLHPIANIKSEFSSRRCQEFEGKSPRMPANTKPFFDPHATVLRTCGVIKRLGRWLDASRFVSSVGLRSKRHPTSVAPLSTQTTRRNHQPHSGRNHSGRMSEEAVLRTLGRGYEVVGRLGAGSFGTVWRARGAATGRQYAIKQIDLAFLTEKVCGYNALACCGRGCFTAAP